MSDLNDLLLKNDDPVFQHVEMWRSFGRQAFANVDVFEMMFWQASEDELNEAIIQYYQEFPESWRKLSGFQVMVFFSYRFPMQFDVLHKSIITDNIFALTSCKFVDKGYSYHC